MELEVYFTILFVTLTITLPVITEYVIYLATRSHEWHARRYGLPTTLESEPERLGRLVDEFKVRKVTEMPQVRERFANATVEGKRVTMVGDVVWWGRVDATVVLGAVKFDDGTYAAVGLEADGSFVFPKPSRLSWPVDNLTAMPHLELDDDHIAVWFAKERYVMAEHKYVFDHDRQTGWYEWQFTGIGSCGPTALREFAKHGMTFTAEEGPPTRH